MGISQDDDQILRVVRAVEELGFTNGVDIFQVNIILDAFAGRKAQPVTIQFGHAATPPLPSVVGMFKNMNSLIQAGFLETVDRSADQAAVQTLRKTTAKQNNFSVRVTESGREYLRKNDVFSPSEPTP